MPGQEADLQTYTADTDKRNPAASGRAATGWTGPLIAERPGYTHAQYVRSVLWRQRIDLAGRKS